MCRPKHASPLHHLQEIRSGYVRGVAGGGEAGARVKGSKRAAPAPAMLRLPSSVLSGFRARSHREARQTCPVQAPCAPRTRGRVSSSHTTRHLDSASFVVRCSVAGDSEGTERAAIGRRDVLTATVLAAAVPGANVSRFFMTASLASPLFIRHQETISAHSCFDTQVRWMQVWLNVPQLRKHLRTGSPTSSRPSTTWCGCDPHTP